jgi:hypothetical protein
MPDAARSEGSAAAGSERPEPSTVAWKWRGQSPEEVGTAARGQAAAARRRGLLGGAIGLLAATGIVFGLHRPGLGAVAGAVAVTIAATALASPLVLYPRLMRAFDLLAHGVGTAVTWVLMVVLYYLLFLPVGLLLRTGGKLGFTRFADPRLASYWNRTEETGPGAEPYRKQF